MSFFKGEEQILYLTISGTDYPIACLTNNSFSEDCDMIETTTLDNEGWKTSRPQNQSYTIDFEGEQIESNVVPLEKLSLDYLRTLKRARVRVIWKIVTQSGVLTEGGYGYITSLSESAPVGDILSFSGTITGYGKVDTSTDYSENYTFEDDNNYIFN